MPDARFLCGAPACQGAGWTGVPPGDGASAVLAPHGSRIPGATYRLQLGANFTFRDARELGVTDCYVSPILQSCAPDAHGYDVADHDQLNQALGGDAGYQALAEALRGHGMG